MGRLVGWLRPEGAPRASFYAGERKGSGRFFNEVSREEGTRLLEDPEGLSVEEVWPSGDVEEREGVSGSMLSLVGGVPVGSVIEGGIRFYASPHQQGLPLEVSD